MKNKDIFLNAETKIEILIRLITVKRHISLLTHSFLMDPFSTP